MAIDIFIKDIIREVDGTVKRVNNEGVHESSDYKDLCKIIDYMATKSKTINNGEENERVYTHTVTRRTELKDPPKSGYILYKDVDEAKAIEWIDSSEESGWRDRIEALLDKGIENEISPGIPVVKSGVPWDK